MAKVTAWGQLGVLVTANAIKAGWVSMPTLRVVKFGGLVAKEIEVTVQTTIILKETWIVGRVG